MPRRLPGVVVLLVALASAPGALAAGRPTDASGTACTFAVPEARPYDTPEGHVRVHYVADPASPHSPALGWHARRGRTRLDRWHR